MVRKLFPILLAILFGCVAAERDIPATDAPDQDEIETTTYVVSVDINPETLDPTITLPDGSVTYSFESYALAIQDIYDADPTADIQVAFGENLSRRIATDLGVATERWGTSVGSYYVHTAWHSGNPWVGGCVQQYRSHLDLHINQSSTQIMALHLLAYYSGGRVCFAAYESIRGFCVNICSPTYTQIRQAIQNAAVAVGIGVTTAYIISQIAAPVAIGALAL